MYCVNMPKWQFASFPYNYNVQNWLCINGYQFKMRWADSVFYQFKMGWADSVCQKSLCFQSHPNGPLHV